MDVEWDDQKAASNLKKHGISFDEAITSLLDPNAVTFLDDHPDEDREITIGHSYKGRLLLVVHVERRGPSIRIISARKATRSEREAYEKGI